MGRGTAGVEEECRQGVGEEAIHVFFPRRLSVE